MHYEGRSEEKREGPAQAMTRHDQSRRAIRLEMVAQQLRDGGVSMSPTVLRSSCVVHEAECFDETAVDSSFNVWQRAPGDVAIGDPVVCVEWFGASEGYEDCVGNGGDVAEQESLRCISLVSVCKVKVQNILTILISKNNLKF